MGLKVAFLGYGEAGRAFARGWGESCSVSGFAYDIKSDAGGEVAAAQAARCAKDGTACCGATGEAIASGEIIVSVVTAAEALKAARAAAESALEGRLYLDCNSCAPQTKAAAAALIKGAGGRYVDVAVMAPVGPKLHQTPMMISGPHAKAALAAMRDLDMSVEIAEGPVGQASGIKLCRSIIVKGLEAISAEMILTARSLGVEDQVIASLEGSYPGFDWTKRSTYALDRMMVHGVRRAYEMAEAARMVEALGLAGSMATATAEMQRLIGALGLDPGAEDLVERADRLRAVLTGDGKT